ncbi:MAG TPA: polysaccharide biosynthesis/export family protein [Phycisphaerae bacterium]|nr:polysaccharide biosynthesis/export family protein [Phycisphaerae bacterium]HOM53718.1 polysaccharide biosynthesis/export family protein [Phycisphaerae bacterium]HOQ87890.1 polysaccharide biosynthesis/export family protein [Phycisphaerae bacterium]HPP29109.1 polysaccharide biosynthesis/export family protein [Phycisphaerae bacterium]HPU28556.1 polysaccharide biosynthesis/export family protein [Phycisphaerae bacterium]
MAVLVALPCAALWAGGCEDHRIPLEAYIAQQEAEAVPAGEIGPDGEPVPPPPLEPWSPGPYRLGPGDVLSVTVAELEKLGVPTVQQARVTEKGEVILPMVGRVQVSGMTLDEAEAQIKAQYVPKYLKDTDVIVQILSYEPIGVMVLGDVLRLSGGAQLVELRRDKASVLQALLAAGGAQDYGGKVTVIPAKDPSAVRTYDLNERADLVRAARPGSVEDADILLVDARPNDAVYVQGLVNAPGPIPLPRTAKLTILQAIAAAGGTMLAFEPREATLMRHSPEGELTSIKIDLDRVKSGELPDMQLAAGDILILPHNAATRIEEYIARSFQLRLGTGIETTYNPWTLYYLRKSNEIGRGGTNTLYDALRTGVLTPFVNVLTPTNAP